MQLALSPTQALLQGFTQPVVPVASGVSRSLAAAGEVQARQGFRIGGLNFMVRYEDGSELTDIPAIHQLPNAPAWLRGIVNLHGSLVPVFDLARFAGVDAHVESHAESGSGTRPMLLVLSHGADAAGIVIDGLPQRLRWSSDAQADPDTAPAAVAPHVRDAAFIDGELWFDLDCRSLLDALENSLAPHSITGA
jgi:chemotaxis signal transduction protein